MHRMLDATDTKVVLALLQDARAPISRLAKRTGLSREIIAYRMKRLQEKQVIKGYLARVNQAVFCAGVGTLLCKLVHCPAQRHAELRGFLDRHPAVNWVAELCGAADLAITFLYKDTQDLARVAAEITDFMGVSLKEHALSLYIDEYKFDRSGLLGEVHEPVAPVSFRQADLPVLDADDTIILSALATQCRLTNADIAKQTVITEDMVRLRIKKYERQGLINGYTLALGENELGFESYYMGLQFRQMDSKTAQKIKQYSQMTPWIVFSARTAGRYDVVLTITVRDREHFREVLQDIKDTFSATLENYEFHLHLQDLKELFLPAGFLTRQ